MLISRFDLGEEHYTQLSLLESTWDPRILFLSELVLRVNKER